MGLTAVLCCLVGTGCGDQLKAKDAHIALLEDTNQKLTDDLTTTRNQINDLTAQRDACQAQLLAASEQAEGLRRQLAAIPEEPAAPEGWQAVPGGAMIAVPGSVLFASGKATLRDKGRLSLDQIAATIQSEYADKDIFVVGHTDDTPIRKSGWKDNYELSAQRALTVVRYLSKQGLTANRLVACGAGEFRPQVPNNNRQNRARNRRVEIFAVNPIQ